MATLIFCFLNTVQLDTTFGVRRDSFIYQRFFWVGVRSELRIVTVAVAFQLGDCTLATAFISAQQMNFLSVTIKCLWFALILLKPRKEKRNMH